MAESLAIVFDLDGTLIDSAPDIHATANRVFGTRGIEPFSFEMVRSFIGNGVGVLVARLLEARGMDAGLKGELADEFVKIYEEAFDLTRVYPGVIEALGALAATGHRLGICTNKPVGPARAALSHFGLDRHMRAVIGGDSLPTRKPDPAPLHAAIAALGGGPALFVGDSEVDAETALCAGVPLALYTEGYRKTAPEALGAALIFQQFSALPGLVAALPPALQRPERPSMTSSVI